MQIHWRAPDAIGERERRRCESRLVRLAEDRHDLVDVWIDVRARTHHRHGGDEVSIRALVRGAEIAARKKGNPSEVALSDALAAFEREIRTLRERREDLRTGALARGSTPPHLGILERIFFERGYGFILTDSGDQIYFHRNSVQGGLDFDSLVEGQRVALNYEPGREGPQATVVRPAPPDAPSL
jgi:cold shock CspA family protein/ribosome-associated translation inhibitor RaiA